MTNYLQLLWFNNKINNTNTKIQLKGDVVSIAKQETSGAIIITGLEIKGVHEHDECNSIQYGHHLCMLYKILMHGDQQILWLQSMCLCLKCIHSKYFKN